MVVPVDLSGLGEPGGEDQHERALLAAWGAAADAGALGYAGYWVGLVT